MKKWIKKTASKIYGFCSDKVSCVWDFSKGILTDENGKLSLGRIAFFVSFSMASTLWWIKNRPVDAKTPWDIPPGLLNVIMFLLAYNVVKIPVKAGVNYLNVKASLFQSVAQKEDKLSGNQDANA